MDSFTTTPYDKNPIFMINLSVPVRIFYEPIVIIYYYVDSVGQCYEKLSHH